MQFTAKAIAGLLAGIALVLGVLAAVYWYRSAANALTEEQLSGYLENAAGHKQLAKWLSEGAHLNKWAAIWTAVSIIASGLCVALDHWPDP